MCVVLKSIKGLSHAPFRETFKAISSVVNFWRLGLRQSSASYDEIATVSLPLDKHRQRFISRPEKRKSLLESFIVRLFDTLLELLVTYRQNSLIQISDLLYLASAIYTIFKLLSIIKTFGPNI